MRRIALTWRQRVSAAILGEVYVDEPAAPASAPTSHLPAVRPDDRGDVWLRGTGTGLQCVPQADGPARFYAGDLARENLGRYL